MTCRTKGPIFVAQKVVVTLFDDIDGSEAAETIAFGLDGKSYEIDLNEANAKKLRKALAPYVDAGRKRSKSGKAYKQTEVAPDPAAVRAWAQANKMEVPPAAASPRRSTRRSPRPGEVLRGRVLRVRQRTLRTADLSRCDNRLALPPADQLMSGARRRAGQKSPARRACGCSSVVEHPPSRGKAQCAIPVTRSAPPYGPRKWIR